MNAVIKAENLGKKYIIGHQKQRGGTTLRDTMTHTARGIWQRIRHPLSPNRESIDLEELWALKDVNFEVQQGERVGIIGPNGAGKSTLLKVLSRITEPTTGKVRIKGRVSSLLEVGTGFHPELTGRENIFLNGAILGMTRQEVKRKFNEIIAFAELEKFLDTPVKRYSSGMYVRLAFAVAAHLEPEILIVDEVLAVGDAAFQKKCLGKMETVAQEGRTVLFVSHNMAAISKICGNAMLLEDGAIADYGPSQDIVETYLQDMDKHKSKHHFERLWEKDVPICLLEASVLSEEMNEKGQFFRDKQVIVKIKYQINEEIDSVHVVSTVLSSDGVIAFMTSDGDLEPQRYKKRKPGTYICKFVVPPNILNHGDYSINISMGIPHITCYQVNNGILSFSVIDKRILRNPRSKMLGLIKLDIPWIYID